MPEKPNIDIRVPSTREPTSIVVPVAVVALFVAGIVSTPYLLFCAAALALSFGGQAIFSLFGWERITVCAGEVTFETQIFSRRIWHRTIPISTITGVRVEQRKLHAPFRLVRMPDPLLGARFDNGQILIKMTRGSYRMGMGLLDDFTELNCVATRISQAISGSGVHA